MSLFGDWIAAVDEDDAEKALLEKVYGRAASASNNAAVCGAASV